MSVQLIMRAQRNSIIFNISIYMCKANITYIYVIILTAYLIIKNGKEKYQRFIYYYNSEWQ